MKKFLIVLCALGALVVPMCSIRVGGIMGNLSQRSEINITKPVIAVSTNSFQKDNNGTKALFEAAIRNDYLEIERIVRSGTDVNARDEEGKTALFFAAINGKEKPSAIITLLHLGADVNAKDKAGWTALLLAIDIVPSGTSASIKALVDGGADVNIADLGGYTPLMIAVDWDWVVVLQMLLERGADPNIKRKDGGTALMTAARLDHADAVEALLRKGADPHVKDNKGRTALMMVKQNIRDEQSGQTPRSNQFTRKSRAKIIKLLKDAEAAT